MCQSDEYGPVTGKPILSTSSRVTVISLTLIHLYSIEVRAAGRETRSLRSLCSVDTVTLDLESVRKGLSALPVLVIGIVTADPLASCPLCVLWSLPCDPYR